MNMGLQLIRGKLIYVVAISATNGVEYCAGDDHRQSYASDDDPGDGSSRKAVISLSRTAQKRGDVGELASIAGTVVAPYVISYVAGADDVCRIELVLISSSAHYLAYSEIEEFWFGISKNSFDFKEIY